MAGEKIEIAKLEFDTSDLIKSAVEAEEALKSLKVEQTKLKESEENQTDALIKNVAAQKAVKKEISEHTKSISELVTSEGKLADVTKLANNALDKEIKSIEGARKNNKELNSIRNKLDLTTKKGRDSLNLMNKKLDENNKFIKENVDQYSKQKIGIGQYEEGITSALGKVTIFGVNLGSVSKSLVAKRAALQADATAQNASNVAVGVGSKALKIFKIALISTGIGALLVALGALVAFFTGTQKGIQAIQRVTIPLKILFESLIGIFERVGETIFDAFSNPKQALKDLVGFIQNQLVNRIKGVIELFKGLISLDFGRMRDAMLQTATGVEDVIQKVRNLASETKSFFDDALERAKEINDLENQIRALSASQVLVRAKLLRQIKEQEIISKSTLKTDKERLGASLEAERLTKGLLDFETAIINAKIRKLQLEQKSNDTLIEGEGSQAELLGLFAQLEDKKREASAIEIKFLGVKNSILKKQQKTADDVQKKKDIQVEKDAQKIIDDAKKQKEKDDKELQRLQGFEDKKTDLKNAIDLLNEENDQVKVELKIEQDLQKQLNELNNIQLNEDEKLELEKLLKEKAGQELAKIDEKFKSDSSKREQDLENQKIALRQKTFDAAINLAGAETRLGKAILAIKNILALKETLLNARSLIAKVKIDTGKAVSSIAEGQAKASAVAPPPFNIPFIIAFIAQVGGIISAIKGAAGAGSTKLEKGGLQQIGGKRHSSGGTKFWGEDGTRFEAEDGELIGVMNRKAAQAFMSFNNEYTRGFSNRNHFQSGGIVSRNSSDIDVQSIITSTMENLPPIVVDVKDIIGEVGNRVKLVDGANI